MRVINEFVDRRTGIRVLPGHPVPPGLDADTIARLVRSRCLAPPVLAHDPGGPASGPEGGGGEATGGPTGAFQGRPSAVAGSDGDPDRERAKPQPGRRSSSKGKDD